MPKGSFNKVEIPRRILKIGVLKTYIIDVRLGSKYVFGIPNGNST